ncbi:MAG: phospholipid carrier-dependent glycosyltransferase, partial [Pseudomonadota bacterium]
MPRRLLTAVALFLGTFVFWALVLWALGRLTAPLAGDEPDYLSRGQGFLAEGWRALADGYRPPGFPLLVALVERTLPGSDHHLALRLINLALASLVPAIWWLAAHALGPDRRVFELTALLVAAWPGFYLLSGRIMAEGMVLLGLSLVLVLAWRWRAMPVWT